ncbi:MAG: hypothetical protein U9N54_08140, partial [candidate division Zixibacteria bacterium]|nr:hypothetical protein [candidate division Zixibacteria bacterium]
SVSFTDSDIPDISSLFITFKIRHPNNSTEDILVDNKPNGIAGLTITDHGGGSYTAQYNYYPGSTQPIGFYDLLTIVNDGTDQTTDDYINNSDELEIVEIFTNNVPSITAGDTKTTKDPVSRIENDTTTIYTSFYDSDIPPVGDFLVTMKIRQPDNSTETILLNASTNGQNGLVITDNGGGVFTAWYNFDPVDSWPIGVYDLYCEVSDGIDNAIDDYTNNLDELEINDVNPNDAPTFTAGITSVAPATQDRFGAGTITISSTFNDPDQPDIGTFTVTFKLRAPYSNPIYTVADNYSNGQNGLNITDNGGGSYTASISYDPPENMELGFYDLYCEVSDGSLSGTDDYANNLDELQITGSGENSSPVVPTDNTYPSPIAIERIGANPTTIYSSFVDADAPAVSVFKATFKVRYPDNSAEIILADNVANGAGVTIIDLGGGVYTASVSWDPPDGQILGVYDLYFHVNDGTDTTYDYFSNNLDELELYDAISNNTPTVISGNTQVIANSVNRIGSDFIMLKSTFDDTDMPGKSSFLVTFKVRDAGSTEYTVVDNSAHDQNGLRIRHLSGSTYEASVLWNPSDVQTLGDYDLYCFVDDQKGGTATDDYTANSNELVITSSAILGDGNLLHRSNNSDNCGGPNSACHNLSDHSGQTCVTCHTPHGSSNIYMVRETITTPNSGDQSVLFKTLGTGDPYNSPDPVAGSNTHGAMADASNAVYTEVCEVCHTTTKYYRNDGSQPSSHNHDVEDCKSACHTHADGFLPGAGSEPSGGDGCGCHSSIYNPMNSSTSSYHHQINSDNADYTTSSKTCLMCHVNHDIFRDDVNSGVGATRAANLRIDITSSVVQG